MEGLTKLTHAGREIWRVDYSGLAPAEIVRLADHSITRALQETELIYVLNIFDERSFATPAVVRKFEEVDRLGGTRIRKQAVVGLTPIKKIILSGFNLVTGRDYRSFDSEEAAIAFLTED